MTIAVLDINDCNLQLWHAEKQVSSPGYTLLEGQQYQFGNAARAQARRRPRDINTRYWGELNTQPLTPTLGPARHTADLVHAHLLDIHQQAGQPDEIIVAVSSSMQRDQLALLLGIAEACPFEVVGLVNRSVALASASSCAGKLYHLEIQLQQALVSELIARDGMIELQRATPLPGCGMLQLQERIVEIIAAAFIRQTRFDPRRQADTEQQLYDALPTTLSALSASSETNLEVAGYRVRVNRNELSTAANHLLRSAPEAMGALGPADLVMLDPIARLLPGTAEQIPRAQLIEAGALRQAIDAQQAALLRRGEPVSFITSLPSLAAPAVPRQLPDSPTSTPATAQRPSPTHLLIDACAQPLLTSGVELTGGWRLQWTAGAWQLTGDASQPLLVNGSLHRPGQSLHCGDSLHTEAGYQAQLIAVVK